MATRTSSSNRTAYLTLGFVLGTGAVMLALCAVLAMSVTPKANAHRVAVPSHLTLVIVAQKPGSTMQGPAYTPNTNIVLPAHTLVTLTIVNQDAGDTPLPAGSPFAKVAGTVGGVAYVDGRPYSTLDVTKVAHTFTVPQIGLSVPIPGDAPAGHQDITVTFSFMTGAAGKYSWQCMDPCGAGASGWEGPMSMPGYMRGTLTIE